MTPSRLRTLATAFGGLITIACLVALVTVLAQQDTWSALVGVIHNHWGVLVGVVGVYVVLVGLQALAWWRLMQATTGTARCAASVGIFALTQVAKYLPGNVGHFVFRYALTRATGAGRAATLTATALEPWLLLLAALVGLVALGNVDWPTLWGWSPWWGWVLPLLALVGAVVGLMWVRGRGWIDGLNPAGLLLPWALQLTFVLASAGLFVQVLALHQPTPAPPVTEVLAAAVLAWLVGFVTPGSPGGLGVREAVLGVALAAWIDPATAVAAVAVFRGVTVLGDGVMFGAGAVWWWLGGRRALADYARHLDPDADADPDADEDG
ncbi:MAG: lysylphosphatidylglycerol synthase domain-containing protein [Wenzhouxiangella sp.]|nr:lysylphosphatidylglycerol synthase domain-containing protein [Wenzhouxiangella sp.]